MNKLRLLPLLMISCAQALEGSIAFDFSGGPIKGYAQIPRGGDFFSTSYQRPTFQEVGLNHNFYYDFDFELEHRNIKILAEFNKIKADSKKNLIQPLATHNQYIPENTSFKMCVHYDWYQFGLGKVFHSFNQRWKLTPFITGDYLKFNYHFYARHIESGRSFNLVSSMLGLEIEYQANIKTVIKALGSATMPLSNLTLYHALLGLEYVLIDTSHAQLLPRIGLELIEINYQDEQNIPNHFRYEGKPHFMAGFKLHFK